MQMIKGTITSVSPLHFGNGRARGTFSQTLSYVPGRTFRGMIGWYLYQYNRELFDACGLAEDHDPEKMHVFFRNGYPLSDKERSVYAPLKSRWCKKCGSLIENDENECTHTVDGRLCLQEGKKHTGLVGMKSFYERRLVQPDPVPKRLETKCPITRDGHTSMGSGWQLSPYHIEGIEPGVSFGFVLLADDRVVDDVVHTLNEASYACGLGGFRSRGYGLVDFSVTTCISDDEYIISRSSELSERDEHLLILNSPCILRTGVSSRIGIDQEFFETINQRLESKGYKGDLAPGSDPNPYITRSVVRGWSLKNGNMVDEIVPATGPGSCMVVTGSPASLAALEIYGIGDMQSSGYGELFVSEVI
ncbi:RAMP superfamily CRISPR-associated protein [Methanospirillum hungatei]|uniref:RAMP superfamily CRISPR-associated protein n=1 Tax=Methanospirillum hungatei TaxID=2203 RepID=UPI0026F03CB4|nr:RAMP superfamily CRISPR-associated protein [Methanospirillum hungatei]MCA1917600.1 RAMP superfamily CRISPR-associated protein [Methanospirillum hungatei]